MKMKDYIKAIFGIMVLVTPMAVEAGPTMVQGRIVSDTVWEASHSPYIVQGKIVIEKGATLTLRPGTRVFFIVMQKNEGINSGFVIEGGLEAIGSETQPVRFTSLIKGEKWGQLYFLHSNPNRSFLKHCVITGGRVVCNNSSPSIEQCSISGSRNAVVVGPGSRPKIIGNRISGNTIGLTFLSETVGTLISNNLIFDNDYGICAEKFVESGIAANHIYGNRLSDWLDPLAHYPAISANSFKPRALQVASAKE